MLPKKWGYLARVLRSGRSIEEIFGLLEQQPKPVILAIDEFQQILQYKQLVFRDMKAEGNPYFGVCDVLFGRWIGG